MKLTIFPGTVWGLPDGDYAYDEFVKPNLYVNKDFFSIALANNEEDLLIEDFHLTVKNKGKWYQCSEIVYAYKFMNYYGHFPKRLKKGHAIQLSFPMRLDQWDKRNLTVIVQCDVNHIRRTFIGKTTPLNVG